MIDIAASIGELVGGIGTLAALIYLALQVRQNNKIARGASRQALLDTFYDRSWETGADPRLAAILAGGLHDWDSLSNPDKTAFTTMMTRWIANIEHGMRLRNDGLVDDQSVEFIAAAMAGCIQTNGGKTWWKQHTGKNVIDEGVADLVESLAASGEVPPFDQTFPYWYEMAKVPSNGKPCIED